MSSTKVEGLRDALIEKGDLIKTVEVVGLVQPTEKMSLKLKR